MRKICLTALAASAAISPAHALDSRMKAGLLALDPDTRLEQRCDAEVLDRIAKEDKRFAPDRVVAYATQEPKMDGDGIKTKGGAFRSKGEWYHVAYNCQTAPDHMQVLSLRYNIGDKIPEDEWEEYNLYP
ncbi:MAG: DUF930 domain-containing protein [Hyphomicrobiales bacterium]|nr:DUF930 domain-containing protein [Hyphomicrobiales bacterium]